jgi:hypothetical protein
MRTSQWLYNPDNGWSQAGGDTIDDPHAILLFGTGDYFRNGCYSEMRERFPLSSIVGCSTAGTVIGQKVDDITTATLIRFEQGSVKVVSEDLENSEDSAEVGEKLARTLNAPALRHVFILSDGLNVNGSELVEGLNQNLPKGVQTTGGLAGDGTRFEQTFVIADDIPKEHRVAAIGFYGESLEINSGCFAGWDEFGAERIITRSEGNVVYEIDGKPALQLYKSYLADEAANLPGSGLKFPISVRKHTMDEPVTRTLLAVDEAAQSLTFAGDVPEGHICRLMKSNIDKLIDHAGFAAKEAQPEDGHADLCIAVSCVGRRIVLSQLVEEELDAVEEVLGNQTPITGFYSYGELAPQQGLLDCQLHNQTMTLTVIQERT